MEYPDDLELDLARLFRAVAGKWLTVLTAAALCAAVVLGVMLFLKAPRYESGVTFYVYDTTADGAFTGDIGTARKQVDSYLVILNTRQTLNEIISAAGVDCTARELEKRIRGRKSEPEEIVQQRLDKARKEMDLLKYYKYVVCNDEVDIAADIIRVIIRKHMERQRNAEQ
jgi:capsular polysaccharide biosynthesis protein